ncbi:hypothetical protein PV08_09490 [Exophiala spinifera]|uniref:Uncharacterized protein n=1 Tax=Exophiala spinifera TaxID=91928 RepID=A0A0D2BLZ9_9EURO|nr:uncharacterized protein PV08_09490 [Exophiala spinifera]KIW12214.1 hypothetical protein PV08_09490 [Exophiala spinifera]
MVEKYPFISQVYAVARRISAEEDKVYHRLLEDSDIRDSQGRADMLRVLKFMESFWTETHKALDVVVQAHRPDLIFGDVLDFQACKDVADKYSIPLATMHPQIPFNLEAPGYMPGLPGFQQKCLTSEHASIWDRLQEQVFAVKMLFSIRHHIAWRRRMRREAGMPAAGLVRKPSHLHLVNAFFGLDVPRPLPPLVVPVGPVIQEHYPPLDPDTASFLESHQRVVYIAFGTHVTMGGERFINIVRGVQLALAAGHIDGVLWALKIAESATTSAFDPDICDILQGRNPRWRLLPWAPQRAILDHTSIVAFVSHCGASSVYESVFHGVPVLGMPIFNDQFKQAKCLREAGVGLVLDKNNFTPLELSTKLAALVADPTGTVKRNCLRMKRIAAIQIKKKSLAVDLIEEVIYDHELRFDWSEHDPEWDVNAPKITATGQRAKRVLRPAHLETADARMSFWKAQNYDLLLVYALVLLSPAVIAGTAWKVLSRTN